MPLEGLEEYEWLSFLPPDDLRCVETNSSDLKPLLVNNILRHFTGHSIDYSDRIIGILGKLLGKNFKGASEFALVPKEIFALVFAAFMQDLRTNSPVNAAPA